MIGVLQTIYIFMGIMVKIALLAVVILFLYGFVLGILDYIQKKKQ